MDVKTDFLEYAQLSLEVAADAHDDGDIERFHERIKLAQVDALIAQTIALRQIADSLADIAEAARIYTLIKTS